MMKSSVRSTFGAVSETSLRTAVVPRRKGSARDGEIRHPGQGPRTPCLRCTGGQGAWPQLRDVLYRCGPHAVATRFRRYSAYRSPRKWTVCPGGKGKLTKWNQDVRAATTDCPTMCVFILDMAFAARAPGEYGNPDGGGHGMSYTPKRSRGGRKDQQSRRAFNVREGLSRADDTLPKDS